MSNTRGDDFSEHDAQYSRNWKEYPETDAGFGVRVTFSRSWETDILREKEPQQEEEDVITIYFCLLVLAP